MANRNSADAKNQREESLTNRDGQLITVGIFIGLAVAIIIGLAEKIFG
mgnify:CR=1 FL=1